MAPLDRIELSTSALPRMRSTTELQRRRRERGLLADGPRGVKHKPRRLTRAPAPLPIRPVSECDKSKAESPSPAAKADRPADSVKRAREARLAAALRSNLRRRKTAALGKPP